LTCGVAGEVPRQRLEERWSLEQASKLLGDIAPYLGAGRRELGVKPRSSVDDGDNILEVVVVKVAGSAIGVGVQLGGAKVRCIDDSETGLATSRR
jgi:hypothetical protein